MSAKPLLLEGVVDTPPPDDRAWCQERQRLEDENRDLQRALEDSERERVRLERGVQSLRMILSPLHRGLKAIFGEIELAVGSEPETAAPSGNHAAPSSTDPRWQSYKNQFPGVPAAVIDALLMHGSMGMTNLAAFLKRAYGTTKNAAYKLKAAGAVTIDRGNVSLKR